MSFITTTALGGASDLFSPFGPTATNAGNFNPSSSVSVGNAILVAVNVRGTTSVAGCALAVGDSQGNSYTLLGQLTYDGSLFAVFGARAIKALQTSDTIFYTINFQTYSSCLGVSVTNCTLNVDFIETNTSSGSNPAPLASGTPGAPYGDAIFGFTGFLMPAGSTTPTVPAGWDSGLLGDVLSDFIVGEQVNFIGVYGAKVFSHTAQTYNPTLSAPAGAQYGQIVIGLTPATVTGTMAVSERHDFLRYLGDTQADPFPPRAGPFYFAYVDGPHVEFDPVEHARWDEHIFSFEIKHDEGQVATLEMSIQNPRVGLLSPARKTWAYLAYQSESGIVPLFFGVLVGIPSDFFAELITVKFNARPDDFIESKQAVAETLRIEPYYDPVFLDESKRDDPDAVLEGWSALYHVDRVTHVTSASDILEGEDGTITFDETAHPIYDSVKMEIGEAPLLTVQVQADVKWTQRCIGYINGPSANISSYTGGSFKGDWPKPGGDVGGGWKCEYSFVNDVLDTEHARTWSVSHNWQSDNPDDGDCSTASMSFSATYTNNPGISIEGTGAREWQTGLCDPEIDLNPQLTAALQSVGGGITNPAPATRPAKINTSGNIALQWILNCVWSLRYDAKREFNESVWMNVTANLQSTLASPTVKENTEVIKVSGADVGMPLQTPFAWSDFINRPVGLGTLIYPNDPLTLGGTAWQICVGAGTAGATQPQFSDIPGTLTADGTVTWASLGNSPPQTQPSWTSATPVPVGEIMIIEPKVFNAEFGSMQTTGASYFFLCVKGGTTNGAYTNFIYLKPATSSDDLPQLPVPFSVILGPGDSAFSNISGSATATNQDLAQAPALSSVPTPDVVPVLDPNFPPPIPPLQPSTTTTIFTDIFEGGPGAGGSVAAPSSTGGTIRDGSVTWYNMGTSPPFLPIPIGGTMTNVVARSYFPTTRGQQSLQYLIAKARARLRLRSRCVKIQWEAPFDECLGLSCRHNATLFDPRLPGGVATGKVTSYTLTADKDGKLLGHVEIGVCVGEANSVPTITGTPEYTAATGYMEPGYQAYDGGQFALAEEDIAYTPPVFSPYDDGLNFPLTFFPGKLSIIRPDQNAQLTTALAQQRSPQLGNVPSTLNALKTPGLAASQVTLMNNSSAVSWLQGGAGEYLIECDPVAAEILIQPVVNGPFNGVYYVTCTRLELPKGIDLQAPSSP